MLDILQSIMKLSNDKKDTLLYFLDDDTCDRVRRYQFVETKDLYLNDSLICINKSTLKIDFTGVIHHMKDDEIILKFNNYSRTIDPDDYHKFMKRRKGERNNRKFFEELLKKL